MNASEEQIQKALRMLGNAEVALQNARALLGGETPDTLKGTAPRVTGENSKAYDEGESQIIEGTFDGQNMIGPNDKMYPVPANYASKSKMIEGDRLKLTILPNGSFLYKQIAPVEREFIKGSLIQEDGQYRVLAEGRKYRVILASVTYYKGEAGDEVTLIVPKGGDSTWGSIEAIIPQVESGEYSANDSF